MHMKLNYIVEFISIFLGTHHEQFPVRCRALHFVFLLCLGQGILDGI